MNWYKGYKIVKDRNGYNLIIYLNSEKAEFSSEIIDDVKKNILTLNGEVNKLVEDKFSNIRINSIKLMLGALVIGTIPFAGHAKVHAETPTTNQVQAAPASFESNRLDATGTVTASRLNVRKGPSTSYSIMHLLWHGNRVKVIGESGNWYQIRLSDGRTGWVSKNYLKLDVNVSTRQQRIDKILSLSKSLLGTPYVWGGSSLQDGGFDCSGFTQYVFKSAGINLNRVSYEQAKQGVAVSRQNLEPGDLVFYSLAGDGRISHVGIYLGNGKMIHSPKTGDVVKITDITTAFWESRYITARRII
ncbi:C40 family peptidase [Clostridium sp. YIM B02515]|uniref:C40 family peptidase n=1 Tax=Clostridium rhizosphaerae TaxID=2803861 RepID=A0ABS1T9M1_9CLOT|nr:SH3 domain-containing C40 family peptidase [Clostridium rhizosphaerae]MBL4936032.1 C40 family peptidase [Clostridium rhizosphaerae]